MCPDVAMVFQNYALYPQMTVEENMSFGVRIRNYSNNDINARVNEAAKTPVGFELSVI